MSSNPAIVVGDAEVIVAATLDDQADFDFDFPIYTADQLAVYVNGVLKTLTTHYSVSGLEVAEGGTVTLLGATAAAIEAGDEVTISRVTPIRRTSKYAQEGDYRSYVVNRDFDLLIMICQELRRETDANTTGLSAEVAARIAADLAHDGRLDALEAVAFAAGNFVVVSAPAARAGTDNLLGMTSLRTKQSIEVRRLVVPCAADIEDLDIPADVEAITTAGWDAPGQGALTTWARVASEPSTHNSWWLSNNGVYFELVNVPELDFITAFGADPTGVRKSDDAYDNWLLFTNAKPNSLFLSGSTLLVPVGADYTFERDHYYADPRAATAYRALERRVIGAGGHGGFLGASIFRVAPIVDIEHGFGAASGQSWLWQDIAIVGMNTKVWHLFKNGSHDVADVPTAFSSFKNRFINFNVNGVAGYSMFTESDAVQTHVEGGWWGSTNGAVPIVLGEDNTGGPGGAGGSTIMFDRTHFYVQDIICANLWSAELHSCIGVWPAIPIRFLPAPTVTGNFTSGNAVIVSVTRDLTTHPDIAIIGKRISAAGYIPANTFVGARTATTITMVDANGAPVAALASNPTIPLHIEGVTFYRVSKIKVHGKDSYFGAPGVDGATVQRKFISIPTGALNGAIEVRDTTLEGYTTGVEVLGSLGGNEIDTVTFLPPDNGVAVKGIVIGASAGSSTVGRLNNFVALQAAGWPGVVDSRVAPAPGSVNLDLTSDHVMAGVGAYETIVSVSAQLAGGWYHVVWCLNPTNGVNAASYFGRVTIGGVVLTGSALGKLIGASITETIFFERMINIPAMAAAATIALQVQQGSGAVGTIQATDGTFAGFLQIIRV